MKLEINLDETRFKDLVEKELGTFTDAEIHDILGKAISQYVMDNEVIRKLFYSKKKDYYGRETEEIEPTSRLERLVHELDVENVLGDVKERIQKVLSEDDIVRKLTESLFYNFVAGKLRDLMWSSGELSSLIQCRANEMIDARIQQQQ